VEGTAQQVDNSIAGWMNFVTVNIIWKLMQSSWTVVLQFERSVLQLTICAMYCTAGGHYYFILNGLCFSEHYEIITAQPVDSVVACWLVCVTVNVMWNVLHSNWTVVLQFELSLLQ